jgi:hypothetical protein
MSAAVAVVKLWYDKNPKRPPDTFLKECLARVQYEHLINYNLFSVAALIRHRYRLILP